MTNRLGDMTQNQPDLDWQLLADSARSWRCKPYSGFRLLRDRLSIIDLYPNVSVGAL